MRNLKGQFMKGHIQRTNSVKLNCIKCGIEYSVPSYRKSTSKYCSSICKRKRIELSCQLCGTKYTARASHKDRSKYCSRICANNGINSKHGKFHHNFGRKRLDVVDNKNRQWKGGVTHLNEKIRKSVAYRDWRIAVFERDNYTCQECGSRGVTLNADHIKPFAFYPELRLVIENGRTLCVPCHKKTDTYAWKAQKYKELHFNINN